MPCYISNDIKAGKKCYEGSNSNHEMIIFHSNVVKVNGKSISEVVSSGNW